MTAAGKKTTFKKALMWCGIVLGGTLSLVPLTLVMRSVSKLGGSSGGAILLEKGKAELGRVAALDRVRSQKLESAKTMRVGTEPCLDAPAVAEPPMQQGSDLDGQLWRQYMRDLTSSDSPFELRGPVTMVGVTTDAGGPRLRKLQSTVSMIEGFLSQGSVRVELPPLPPAENWQRDVTILVEDHRDPHVLQGNREFEPGRASGTAILFDYERGDVVCVGHFVATNSDALVASFRQEDGGEFTSDLFRDLEARVIVEGVHSLRAVSGAP